MNYFKTNLLFLLYFIIANALNIDDQWEKFKLTFNKKYSEEEELWRKNIWKENWFHIQNHNQGVQRKANSYVLDINEFADMSHEEFTRNYNGLKPSLKAGKAIKNSIVFKYNNISELPEFVDWREKKAVTPIKNQKSCGDCWAFSAVGSLESRVALKTGQIISLSEQNLLDCANSSYGNHGCRGGLMDNAFDYIIENGGIDTEDSYPYEGEQRNCRFDPTKTGAKISSYSVIEHHNETALQIAVALIGPVAIGINAGLRSFQFYRKGVYDEADCSPKRLNHAVLLIGYGIDDTGKDYWLVKNSWGAGWGDGGYIKMSRNQENQCGIASLASFPNL